MTTLYLLDNTVLTNFALVNQSVLLTHLWGTGASTTSSALVEYQTGVSTGLLPPDAWKNLPVVTLKEEETDFAANLPSRLGAGERTCLAVALHRQGVLVTDDLDARHIARRYNVVTTGTIGILVQCVRQHHLDRVQAEDLLAEMRSHGYRSPVNSLASLLDE